MQHQYLLVCVCEYVPDSFCHLDMTGKGQAADPLTVNRRSLAACLRTQQAGMLDNILLLIDITAWHIAV